MPEGRGAENNFDVLLVPVGQFETWFQLRLEKKYIRDIDRVFSAMRPVLLYYSQLSRLCSNFIIALINTGDPDILSLRVPLDSTLHLIESLVGVIPNCIDFPYLQDFCLASTECISNIKIHLHPLSHKQIAQDDYDMQKVIMPHIKSITNLIEKHKALLKTFREQVDKNKNFLQFLTNIKTKFTERIKFLGSQLTIVKEAQSRSEQFRTLTIRHTQLHKEYHNLLQNEKLVEGRRLNKQVEQCEHHLNSLTDPFFRACQQLKNKKRIIREGAEVAEEDLHVLNEFCAVMQRSLLYEHMRTVSSHTEFGYFIKLLARSVKQDSLTLSQKNQDLILHAKRNFDFVQWSSIFEKWVLLKNQLSELEDNDDYQLKFEQFEVAMKDYEEIRRSYEKLSAQFHDDIAHYHSFISYFNSIRNDVAHCCLQEFQERIELILEEDNSSENENQH